MPASGGRTVSSAALKGKPYLLYFYPKADTPGCTKQACGVQEALPALGKLGLEVIGVSPDPMPPIEKFAKKYKLTFPLASDEDHGRRGLWRVGREVDVRQDLHGHGAVELPGGRRREGREDLAQGEAGGARGAGDGGGEGAG
jgi:peroxiredoxin